MFGRLKSLRESILDEVKLPDYTGRHLFTTKLRLLIFLACWGLVLAFFPFVWEVSPYTPLIFNVAFLITAICYNNVLHGRAFFSSLFFEIMADFVSQTTIIYLSGGKSNHFFLIYVLYCTAVGTFYGPRLATLAAVIAVICYAVLLFLLHFDTIPVIDYGAIPGLVDSNFMPIFYLVLTTIFLAIVIYGIRIANYFSKLKENALEERNKQLLALHKISSTIHNVSFLEPVIEQVLQGVIQGLGYDICLLALLSRTEEKIHFFAPKDLPLARQVFRDLGVPMSAITLPLQKESRNAAYQAIQKNQIIFRNDLWELVADLQSADLQSADLQSADLESTDLRSTDFDPSLLQERSRQLQEKMGWKKFIIIPLVSERKVIGALIGISRIAYVEQSSVGILEHFASQAALAIESAYLFDELRQKNVELEEAYRVKSEFLAMMSHELRTPLHAILGFSELLSDGSMGNLGVEQRNALNEIHNNAKNLSELINHILDLAKAEAGKMELSMGEFDFRAVVEQVIYSLSPLLDAKYLDRRVDYGTSGPLTVTADAAKLRQVLTNLMSNAIKFTHAGGNITISCRRMSGEEAALRMASNGWNGAEALYVEVADSGIGISPENQRELFQPFKQVDPSFTRRYQGTGLGLALCRELIALHKGYIGVESELGKGSRFYFLIRG